MILGLGMIVKDEFEAVKDLVTQAEPYFDRIYITCTHKPSLKKFKELAIGKINVSYFEWNKRFDEARNFNLSQFHDDVTHYMWLDADDVFPFEQIPLLRTYARQYDVIWLPYEYAHDEDGNVIALHWRERIINLSKPFEWRGWIHENFICDEPVTSKRVNIPVIHRSDHKEESDKRNHDILLQAYQSTKDPRYVHYLGLSYFSQGKWQEAIDIFKEYVAVGGWDEEIYRSLLRMGEAANHLGRPDDTRQYYLQAVSLLPQYPQAYFQLAQLEYEQDEWSRCLEWLKVAFSKPEPESASIIDPTVPDRAKFIGAVCEHKLGNNSQAVALLKQVETLEVDDLLPALEREASVDRLAAILPALYKHYDTPSFLWENLKEDLKFDNRFRKVREALTKPKEWPENSVVFFCGKGYEEWGPHTLDKGMGGSEEAVVYISRELAYLGYNVTVFGEVSHPFTEDTGVEWLPWTYVDKRDTFDTLIIWRQPQFAPQFTARKKFVDMHDLFPKKVVKPYPDTTYLFKSQYHKDQYPDVTNYKIIGNGILKSQFEGEKDKRPGSVGYFSAYYRGLECLVDMWPSIRKEVPDATLDIYYGWQSWVTMEGEDEFYHRMTQKLEAVKDQGVTEHGRVSHEELAKAMKDIQVWAYPTQFPEIHCITALKAQEAECWPVVTDVAALQETVQTGDRIESERIYSDEYNQKKFVRKVVEALKDGKRGKPVDGCDWSEVAQAWKETIDG